jgi:8-oxo-dGTP pyrophosphatase MutT (NUDIX family)
MDGASPNLPDKIGPWTRLSSRDLYENPWIHLREDKVLTPMGSPGIYGVVHFKNLAIAVVPIDAQGRVILVGQHRYPFDRYFWEIPEGGCPIGLETPLDAGRRELREETGYAAARWDDLGDIVLSNATTDETGRLFLARELTPGSAEPDPTEKIAVRHLDFQEAWRMAMEGEITESLTVAALARARHFLERERTQAAQGTRQA